MESSLISPLIIYKYIKNNSKTYYLSLRTYGSTVNVGETGVIILFADGTKMTKNNEIDVKAGSNSFTYSSFIRLSQADLEILKIKKIKKFRLYIYDKDITSSDADKFQIYVKCIIDKN